MSTTICESCNRPFTHAGYSRHLSMTTRSSCRALYRSRLDTSGLEVSNLAGGSGPATGGSGE
jgi:hypothetical protein